MTDWDRDRVEIEWTPPESDGGSPLERYVVEKKGPSGEWEYATEVPSDQTKALITGLKEGQQYQFRVKAANKAGESTPSDPSRTVTCRPRNRKSTLDDMTV